MLGYITVIFCCQLIGELIVAALSLPLPGPVLGMVLLLAGLIIKGSVPDDLSAVGDFLLRNLSLLFVPAGVGVMLHMELLGRDWLQLTAALVLSTLLTIALTALLMKVLARKSGGQGVDPQEAGQ
ncbi:MAG: CidA/LrgA family protein [Pseudomonadota bacterium]